VEKSVRNLLGFRVWLFFLAAFAVLPMIAFSLVSVLELIRSQREVETILLSRRAATMAGALERHLAARVAMLNAIAHGDAARQGDIEALYNHAARLVSLSPGVLGMALLDAEGTLLFNTLRPFGQQLPRTTDSDSARRVIETGRPLVSGVTLGVISNAPVTTLGVPVWVNNRPRYCLRAVMPVEDLADLLGDQHLPEHWIVSIVDDQGRLVAQNHAAHDAVGTPVSAALLEALRQGMPVTSGVVAHTGEPGETALAKVSGWGWTVAVTVPEPTLAAPLRRMLVKFGLGGTVCLSAGLMASYWLSRRLTRDMDLIASASAALEAGGRPAVGRAVTREMQEVEACLFAAKDREDLAKTDPLTRLPGRARFWEMAQCLERQCRDDDTLGLAVMFIDLDGFKQVNDRHGHKRGDWVLARAAAVVRSTMRDADVAGRLGGDEFAVCLVAPRGHLRAAAASLAGRIVARVGNLGYGIGCSIGVAICDGGGPNLEQALLAADEAMYEAKRGGKNQFVMRETSPGDEVLVGPV
jgi:diguanylate cyclase (GGDEF)-like protein